MKAQVDLFGSDYSVEAVMSLAHNIKAALNEHRTSGRGQSIAIGGSFPNGKANIGTSDIDLTTRIPQDEFKDWLPAVEESLSLELGGEATEINLTAKGVEFFSSFNSVVLVVSADEIKMLVFPPADKLRRENSRKFRLVNFESMC